MSIDSHTYWTARDAAMAWGIEPREVTRICRSGRIPEAEQKIIDGRATWTMPVDTPHPVKLKPGVKPKPKTEENK